MKLLFVPFFLFSSIASLFAQSPTALVHLEGRVSLKDSGGPVKNAVVTIEQLKRSVLTGRDGKYEFADVPSGNYDVIVHLDRVANVARVVDATRATTTVDFELTLNSISEQVTVTASGSAESINNSYQAVSTVGAIQIAENNPISIGDAIDNQPGVAKRSFGPASGRPVIRGFDGDRVLILQNGLRVGGISSQSGDEVEPIDVLSLDRIEIVRGPATLLYGSNAIGGAVNGISTNDLYQNGLSGYLTAFGSTTNSQAGTSSGLKYGLKNFLFFANGGAQKANDYRTPIGTVLNSYSKNGAASGGFGWFPRKGWLSVTYADDRRRYGIPVQPDAIDFEYLVMRRHNYEIKGGLRGLDGFVESADFGVSYNDYKHTEFEFESDENHTEEESNAFNRNLNYRAKFNHRRVGKFSGTFGFSGFTRDYASIGSEAPAPRTKQHSVAVYALERIDYERVGFQFGGRVERNSYDPEGNLPSRTFTGFSGGAGLRVPLWSGGSVVANYQHSYRAPALEELYDNGRHPGLLVFDIGNPNLTAEQADGIDVGIRHTSDRFRFASGLFYYNIQNFVYMAFTGATDPGSELRIINYAQSNSRYTGAEATFDAKLHTNLWLNTKVDFVRADLVDLSKDLPRIPPFRASIGLDWNYKGFSVRPVIRLAARQTRVYDYETPTTGYAVFDANASYTLIRDRLVHVFSIGGFNLGDKLYRNHLSFIKDLAPEIGRGVRGSYTLRF